MQHLETQNMGLWFLVSQVWVEQGPQVNTVHKFRITVNVQQTYLNIGFAVAYSDVESEMDDVRKNLYLEIFCADLYTGVKERIEQLNREFESRIKIENEQTCKLVVCDNVKQNCKLLSITNLELVEAFTVL